ncbi:MAG TPA: hypothetical protein VMB91_03740 [Solirubrobacteraceae bacterium]|nr:hypothetical protein [Solirubrobacteraceae bacterium]
MSPEPTRRTPEGRARGSRRAAPNLRLLLVCEPFGSSLGAEAVARWLTRGLEEGGLPGPDLLPLPGGLGAGPQLSELLEHEHFHQRLADARALVIATALLDGRRLQDTSAFELATRARQGGVPSYAVTGENGLDSFQARILDLQLILLAAAPRSLRAAGRGLAEEVLAGLR